MAWTGLTLTVEGRNALNKAQSSGKLNFKSIVVGDGNAPANFSTMRGLVHQLYEVENLMVEVEADSCTLTADFPNVDYDYYFREIGVIVNTDDGPKLYVYDNCGEDAQYIVTTSGVENTRKRIRLLLKISDVAEINVEKPEVLYVSYTDMQKSQAEMEERIINALEEKADNSTMTAATASVAGKAGLVPAPAAGMQAEYLKADGTWESVDDHIAVFTSGDAVEPTGWADIDLVESGEEHKSLWRKFSLTVKNLRYLYKKLGTTDISKIGDGTLTGAVSALNTDIGRIGKLLFSTSYQTAFKSGSITVPGISSYQTYIGWFYAAQASPMIGFKTGSLIVFTGSLITAEMPVAAYTVVNISGDKITFNRGNAIIQIYGLF